jgi:hypothetical protein
LFVADEPCCFVEEKEISFSVSRTFHRSVCLEKDISFIISRKMGRINLEKGSVIAEEEEEEAFQEEHGRWRFTEKVLRVLYLIDQERMFSHEECTISNSRTEEKNCTMRELGRCNN